MRILFVDDETHLLAGLRRLTRANRHWTTFFAGGGAEALELLQATPVDVVVTDMRMPGMDGLELMEVLRERFPDLGRIGLTGYVDSERGRRAESLADAWLTKPCSLDVLTAAVAEVHARSQPSVAGP